MGGKALKPYGVFTERKTTEEYNQIGNELICKLFFDLSLFSKVVKCYHTKDDHGDLDLLVEITKEFHLKNIDLKEYFKNNFKPKAIHSNGGVLSFDYQNFQIDIIPIKESRWEIANTYFSYDPLGNIMGKTFHKFGLSYGWDGLYYKFRSFSGRNTENILLTTDVKKIFEFGGYDYERYLLGFDTLEDIFKFVINSKYFDNEIFQMKNLKYIDKKRNRKRVSYHIFLNYLKDNNITNTYHFDKNKDNYLNEIDNFFPEANLLVKLEKLKNTDKLNKELSEKFNGNIIMSWFPELQGKELGIAITKFKAFVGENYKNFILNNSVETIREQFTKIYHE